jgi:hypothetical protein
MMVVLVGNAGTVGLLGWLDSWDGMVIGMVRSLG